MARKKSDYNQKMRELNEENSYHSSLQNRTRARSFTVGSGGNGIIEVAMRGDFGSLWMPLQPVEIAEYVEQLAAAAGLEIAMRPKQNFAAWRPWETPETEASKYHKGLPDWELVHQTKAKILGRIQMKADVEVQKQAILLEMERILNELPSSNQKQIESSSKSKRGRRKKVEEDTNLTPSQEENEQSTEQYN